MTESVSFVGDSLTAGGRWDEWFPEFSVRNHGTGGATTADILAGIDVLISEEPDAFVLLIGTNDLAWRKSVEHVVRNIESILVIVHKQLPTTKILMQSVLPREPSFAPAIRDINRHLRQFSGTVRAQYLDLWPLLADEVGALHPAHSDDGLHLTTDGYEQWLGALRPAMENLFAVRTATTPIDTIPDATGTGGRFLTALR